MLGKGTLKCSPLLLQELLLCVPHPLLIKHSRAAENSVYFPMFQYKLILTAFAHSLVVLWKNGPSEFPSSPFSLAPTLVSFYVFTSERLSVTFHSWSAFGSHGPYRGGVRAGGRRSLFFSRWWLGAYGTPAQCACPRSQLAEWVPTSDARSVSLVQRGTRLAPGPQPSCLYGPNTAAPRGSAVQTPEFLPGFLASATMVPPKILLTLSSWRRDWISKKPLASS